MAMLEKTALGKYKSKFELHVLLIIEQEKVSASQARVQAWAEGIDGLGKRLGPLPAGPGPK